MKHFLYLVAFLCALTAQAQNVGIGTSTPNNSAQVDISSNLRGLLIPRMMTAAIGSIANPAKGLMVYDSTKNQLVANMGTAASPNWQNMIFGTGWALTGNSGTNPATQFIGSTDGKAVRFRVNNIPSGQMDTAGNVFWGLRAGQANTSGYSNIAIGTDALNAGTTIGGLVAIGDSALSSNTTGYGVTAIGTRALYANTTGAANTAIGVRSLADNTTGFSNSAVGYSALAVNTTGFSNSAFGQQAMNANSTGYDNSAFGAFALVRQSTARENTAVGYGAAFSTATGGWNAAVGSKALYNNIDGGDNTAIGSGALFNTNSSYNTGVGSNSLNYNTYAMYNTAIGYNSGDSKGAPLGYNNVFLGANTGFTGGSDFYNCIAIGQDVYCTGSNQVRIGNEATSSIGGHVGWSTISDGRVKKDIVENVKGLEFIMRLRPVTYRLDMNAINQRKAKPAVNGKAVALKVNATDNDTRLQTGFIAQEVEEASKQSGYEFAGVDKPKNANDLYSLRYSDFVAPMVKAIQELSNKVDRLQQENDLLRKNYESIKKQINKN